MSGGTSKPKAAPGPKTGAALKKQLKSMPPEERKKALARSQKMFKSFMSQVLSQLKKYKRFEKDGEEPPPYQSVMLEEYRRFAVPLLLAQNEIMARAAKRDSGDGMAIELAEKFCAKVTDEVVEANAVQFAQYFMIDAVSNFDLEKYDKEVGDED
jgi:hypothetical protein